MIEIEAEILSMRLQTHEHVATRTDPRQPEPTMKRLALGILGAAALTTTLLLAYRDMAPAAISLDRIREAGL